MARQSSAVVKVKPQTHARLLDIAREDDRSMGDVISDLLDRYETERFWAGVKQDIAALEADPDARAQYDAELDAWDSTVGDGLENEEPYYSDDAER